MSTRQLAEPAVPGIAASIPGGGRSDRGGIPFAAVSALTLLGGLLRVARLGAKPLWFDEAVQYGIARTPLSGFLAENVRANSAPPLYSLALKAVAAVGDSEAALRAIACVAGILAVPAMYLLARRFLDRLPAYGVALLTALSPMQIRYSQQVREYSLAFLVAALLLAAAHAFAERPDRRRWAALAAALVAGTLLQYGLSVLSGAVLAVLGVLAAAAGGDRRKPLLAGVGAAGAVWLAALAAVWSLALREQARAAAGGPGLAASYLREGVWSGAPSDLPRLAFGGTRSLVTGAFPGELFAFLAALGLVAAWRRRARFALLALAAPTGAVFLLACAALYPYGGGRQDIFLMPMILVFSGFGASLLLRRPADAWVAGLLAALLAFTGAREARRYLGDPGIEDVRPLLRALAEGRRPGDRVYVYREARPAFAYYTRGTADAAVVLGARSESPADLVRDVERELGRPGRLWILVSHCVKDDCELLEERAAGRRSVERIAGDDTAWLSLAR